MSRSQSTVKEGALKLVGVPGSEEGKEPARARATISCLDRPGIVAAVATFLYEHGANITRSDQHSTDPHGGHFFMRTEFTLDGVTLERSELEDAFARDVAAELGMDWRLSYTDRIPRVALLVSRHDHCLLDLLWRFSRGELHGTPVRVVSNHPDLRAAVEPFGIEYAHVPFDKSRRDEAEDAMLELLAGQVDLVVLARFMQVLSERFLAEVGAPAINIHHSFLPSFAGADPYRRAVERGVKLVGATAHYATEELDEGPIIEQGIHRISHRDSVEDVVRIGRDIERTVLTKAVKWHLEERVLVHAGTTFVF